MENKKQELAIEWFVKKLCEKFEIRGKGSVLELLQEAVEMQKKQLSHAYYQDRLTADVEIGMSQDWEFEQYYNENYGK